MSDQIKLLVNEKDIPINPFVKIIVRDINLAILKNLREIPEDIKKITIILD
jgi:hypothetical protein